MRQIRCAACDEPFTPKKHVPHQRFCSKPVFKRERRRCWQLASGPEGAWHKDLGVIKSVLKRLIKQIPTSFSAPQLPAERAQLLKPYQQTQAQFHTLDRQLKQATGDDHA